MTLQELYELELQNYKKTKIKEDPAVLLAMLLLAKKDKFKPVKKSNGVIFKLYESLLLLDVMKVEKDFGWSRKDIMNYALEKYGFRRDSYEKTRIWVVFYPALDCFFHELMYPTNRTAEEIFLEKFERDYSVFGHSLSLILKEGK